METYQQRVVEEKAELDEKITKLDKFLKNSNIVIETRQKELMTDQLEVMTKYSDILGYRIDLF